MFEWFKALVYKGGHFGGLSILMHRLESYGRVLATGVLGLYSIQLNRRLQTFSLFFLKEPSCINSHGDL